MKLSTVVYYICLLKVFKHQNIQATLTKGMHELINKDEVVDRAVTIISQCFNDKSKALVVSTDMTNFNDHHHLLKTLHSSVQSLSLVGPQPNNSKPNHTISYPATNFVLSVFSGRREYELLRRVRESAWWNHEGTFLVVVRGCWRAARMLRMLWTFNVLSGVLLCYNEGDERMRLYISNPFSRHAPDFWRLVESNVDEMSGHPWTLFEHALVKEDYLQGTQICANLNFLKTTNLHGYPVRIGVALSDIMVYLKSGGNADLDNVDGEFGVIARTLWSHLNATPRLQFYADMHYRKSARSHGLFEDLNANRIDYGMNMMFLRDIWKRQLYPITVSGICAVSSMQGKSATQKFLIVFNSSAWFAIAGLCLVALLILKFLVTPKSWPACSLEVIRMTVGMPSLSRPRGTKQFFAIFLLTTMLANFFLQYLVNSLYMLPNFDAVINTLDDLVAANLTIYGSPNFREFFKPYAGLLQRYRVYDQGLYKCLPLLYHGGDIVCIYFCKVSNITDHRLVHVAKHMMMEFPITFTIREDWPLASRVNDVFARMSEAGLLRLFTNREVQKFQKYVQKKEKWSSVNLYTALPTFLGFAWSIGFATCVFFMEIGVYRGSMIVRRYFAGST